MRLIILVFFGALMKEMDPYESPIKKIRGRGQISCQQQTKGQVPVWVLRHGFSLSPAVVFVQGWAQVHCSTPLFHGLKTCAGACYHVHQWIISIIWNSRAQHELMSKLFFKNPRPFWPWVTQSLQEAATYPDVEISVQGNLHSPSLHQDSGGLLIFVFAKVV